MSTIFLFGIFHFVNYLIIYYFDKTITWLKKCEFSFLISRGLVNFIVSTNRVHRVFFSHHCELNHSNLFSLFLVLHVSPSGIIIISVWSNTPDKVKVEVYSNYNKQNLNYFPTFLIKIIHMPFVAFVTLLLLKGKVKLSSELSEPFLNLVDSFDEIHTHTHSHKILNIGRTSSTRHIRNWPTIFCTKHVSWLHYKDAKWVLANGKILTHWESPDSLVNRKYL